MTTNNRPFYYLTLFVQVFVMKIEISSHAKERMKVYDISKNLIEDTVRNPDNIVEGYGGRKIYQKKLNGYVLRVIVEMSKGINKVITIYPARSGRYEI